MQYEARNLIYPGPGFLVTREKKDFWKYVKFCSYVAVGHDIKSCADFYHSLFLLILPCFSFSSSPKLLFLFLPRPPKSCFSFDLTPKIYISTFLNFSPHWSNRLTDCPPTPLLSKNVVHLIHLCPKILSTNSTFVQKCCPPPPLVSKNFWTQVD